MIQKDLIDFIDCNIQNHYSRIIVNPTLNYRCAQIYLALSDTYNDRIESIFSVLNSYKSHVFGDEFVRESEMRQLLEGDVPSFYTRVDSRDLVDGFGEVRKNALPYSFLDDFSNLLGMIRDANYIDRQCKIAVNQIRKYENALERRDQ